MAARELQAVHEGEIAVLYSRNKALVPSSKWMRTWSRWGCGLLATLIAVASPAADRVLDAVSDDEADVTQLEQACGSGVIGSCAELGGRFADGNGVTQNPAKAATFFDKACEGGEADSCTLLGIAYHEGQGVVPAPERAAVAFARACELGGAGACGNFGLALVKGEGVSKDVERAFGYFTLACKADNAASCSSLGAAYSMGIGVRANARKAKRLFKKSCDGAMPADVTTWVWCTIRAWASARTRSGLRHSILAPVMRMTAQHVATWERWFRMATASPGTWNVLPNFSASPVSWAMLTDASTLALRIMRVRVSGAIGTGPGHILNER